MVWKNLEISGRVLTVMRIQAACFPTGDEDSKKEQKTKKNKKKDEDQASDGTTSW